MPGLCRWGQPKPGQWRHYEADGISAQRMSVITAASAPGCGAYTGEFTGQPKDDGDLEHIRRQLGTGTPLPANRGFLLSPDSVHESMPLNKDTQRIFLRLVTHLQPLS